MLSRKLALAAAGNAAAATYVDDVFSTYLYDGTGSAQTIANGIDLSGEGGLVWAKSRSSRNHIFSDTERGTGKVLFSNLTAGEDTDSTTITSYNSNGFTMGTSTLKMNTSGEEFCSWTFRKCPGFFDVVTYTGNGSHRDISHSLGSEPGSIWIKRTDSAESWIFYHRSLDPGGGSGATAHFAKLELESTGSEYGGTLLWSSSGGGEDHTASTFHVSNHSSINANGGSFVAYIFAHDDQSFGDNGNEAVIKCGSFNSTGSVVDINLGFEPQWLLVKRSDASNSWIVVDNMRGNPVGYAARYLEPNASGAESTLTGWTVPTPTGFTNNYPINGGKFIYIAIRRPHKPPEAATDVFAVDTNDGGQSANTPSFVSNFPVDLLIRRNQINNTDSPEFATRLTREVQNITTISSVFDGGSTIFGYNNGVYKLNYVRATDYVWMFKRAPKFLDVVAYTGNGVQGRNITHSLGVAPDLMIVKNRDTSNDDWYVYVSGITHLSVYGSDPDSYGSNPARLYLNQTETAGFSSSGVWDHTHPTATTFRVGDTGGTNGNNEDLIAFLFATLPGISKIGSYSGNGGNQDIDCGFTNGARFVLIKRTDSADNWHLFDTTQGINSGNDPYYRLDLTAAQSTGNDFIDPLSSGFKLVTNDGAINASGGTYIFLAIA